MLYLPQKRVIFSAISSIEFPMKPRGSDRLIVAMQDERGPAGAPVARPSNNEGDCSGSCMVDFPSRNGLPKPHVGTHASSSSQRGYTNFKRSHLKPLKPGIRCNFMLNCRMIWFSEGLVFVFPVLPWPFRPNRCHDWQRLFPILKKVPRSSSFVPFVVMPC